ncbi:hypothetical protein ASPFODRAFT_379074 [Aspergillus luchuensis CBS 106.47]|uniref:Uncharacterized protein n=1 Tax=Aspergillus luchuensis (strain CBS 106.47) TaxID=1137211 RepID=A0A1M3T4B8_ASPLC|nr:hypothetical protein ASPFODRAFT_379074 [Aspergillus luchuensis CBS 106.47]
MVNVCLRRAWKIPSLSVSVSLSLSLPLKKSLRHPRHSIHLVSSLPIPSIHPSIHPLPILSLSHYSTSSPSFPIPPGCDCFRSLHHCILIYILHTTLISSSLQSHPPQLPDCLTAD